MTLTVTCKKADGTVAFYSTKSATFNLDPFGTGDEVHLVDGTRIQSGTVDIESHSGRWIATYILVPKDPDFQPL